MTKKKLHILNGDSTKQIFEKTTLDGDVIVWREMLCEGPIKNTFGSDEFWKSRYQYFEKELGVQKLEYYDKTIKEIIKLEDLSSVNEVVLWFEYDLFCQINLLAACSYLLQSYRKDILYYLVCTGKEQGNPQLQTLSDYTPLTYNTLYENKIKLTKNNLQFAETCWNLYVQNDKEKLSKFDFNQNLKFAYLQKAIQQHLQRFPEKNGLNQIENKILELIHSGLTDKNKIIKQMLIWQKKETVYGFGDLQYFMLLKKLKPYFTDKKNVILLNNNGENLMQ